MNTEKANQKVFTIPTVACDICYYNHKKTVVKSLEIYAMLITSELKTNYDYAVVNFT